MGSSTLKTRVSILVFLEPLLRLTHPGTGRRLESVSILVFLEPLLRQELRDLAVEGEIRFNPCFSGTTT